MGLTVTLYRPTLKTWGEEKPSDIKSIDFNEGSKQLFSYFYNYVHECGVIEYDIDAAFAEHGLVKHNLIWISTKMVNGFPEYQYLNKYTGQGIKIKNVPMKIAAYKQMYAQRIDSVRINDKYIHPSYIKLGRQGLVFVHKTELIKEVADFFPGQMLEFEKWWNGGGEIQFKNGETFVHFE